MGERIEIVVREQSDDEYLRRAETAINKVYWILDKSCDVEGEHHLRWILDQIARAICHPSVYNKRFASKGNWDTGTPP